MLFDNYPNPFNPSTTIQYEIPKTARVVLKIYDMLGREVKILVNRVQSPGQKSVIWDGTDQSGNLVSSGIYLYRLQSGEFTESKKMILMK
jgi:flagellar hook assembly protein FlgD